MLNSILSFLPILCSVLSVGLFISLFPTYNRVARDATSLPPSMIPALSVVLMCLFWFSYATLLPDWNFVLLGVNFFGILCSLVCVRGSWKQHLRYWSAEESDVRRGQSESGDESASGSRAKYWKFWAKVGVVGLLWAIGFGGSLAVAKSGMYESLTFLPGISPESDWFMAWSAMVGLLAATCSVMMFGSPLAEIFKVIKTRDASRIPTLMTIANIIAALAWTAYGIVLRDYFVTVPNGLGALLALFAAGIKIWFWKRGNSTNS